jgi:hypothetical protein
VAEVFAAGTLASHPMRTLDAIWRDSKLWVMEVVTMTDWKKKHKAQIKKGLCAHLGCKRHHIEGNRCCKEHAAYYRERNRRYAARVKKGQVGK